MSWHETDVQRLEGLAHRRRQIEADIRSQISLLRQQECPWSVIGDALGVSKQAAQRKYASVRVSSEDQPLPIGGD